MHFILMSNFYEIILEFSKFDVLVNQESLFGKRVNTLQVHISKQANVPLCN